MAGSALLYDVDPLVSNQLLVTATNADAGICSQISASYGLNGQVQVSGNALSIAPFVLP